MNTNEMTNKTNRLPFIERLAIKLSNIALNNIPDGLIIAFYLTLACFVMALITTDSTPVDLVWHWGAGFWGLLEFGMQMTLILFFGTVLANAPSVSNLLTRIAGIPQTPRQAILFIGFTSMVLALLNWSLSIAGSIIILRTIAKRQLGADYRLMVAASYLGMGCTWHAGLSASIPLWVATPGHFMQSVTGVIPISETLFTSSHLALSATVVGVMTAALYFLQPSKENTVVASPDVLESLKDFTPPERPKEMTPANRQEFSKVLNLVIGGMGLIWIAMHFYQNGFALTLNTVIFILLMLALFLHPNPASFLKACSGAGVLVWGIILQYPFYAGIFGIINNSGLNGVLEHWLLSISTQFNYPAIVYVYSGILNYFIPSGGSKWVLQAAHVLDASRVLGVPYTHTIMAYAWGDMSTNIIQPLWVLPMLSAANLRFRDIMGFCIILFAVYVSIPMIFLTFLPF